MISPITFRPIRSARVLTTAVLCSAIVLIAVITFYPERLSHAANQNASMTFEDRVAAQRAIEAVYWRRRIWPADNPQIKPPLDEVMPDAAIRAKIADYLRKSSALKAYWRRAEAELRLQVEAGDSESARAMSGERREVEWRQSIEQAPELALSSSGDTVYVKYSPRIENDQLQQDELAILYILMTAKDGRLLDQDITSPGGQGIAYRQDPGPNHTIFFTTVIEKKGGKFIGYLFFITERSFREILGEEGSITLPLKPPSSDFNLNRLGVNAKVSVAIAVENPKKKGNRFIRFATDVSTAELTATAQ